jgi:hypothetical protein
MPRKKTEKAAPPAPETAPDIGFDPKIQAELEVYASLRKWGENLSRAVQLVHRASLDIGDFVKLLPPSDEQLRDRIKEPLRLIVEQKNALYDLVLGEKDRFKNRPLLACLETIQSQEETIRLLSRRIEKQREMITKLGAELAAAAEAVK